MSCVPCYFSIIKHSTHNNPLLLRLCVNYKYFPQIELHVTHIDLLPHVKERVEIDCEALSR